MEQVLGMIRQNRAIASRDRQTALGEERLAFEKEEVDKEEGYFESLGTLQREYINKGLLSIDDDTGELVLNDKAKKLFREGKLQDLTQLAINSGVKAEGVDGNFLFGAPEINYNIRGDDGKPMYVITGSRVNPDGSPIPGGEGVATEGGSMDPNAPVLTFSEDKIFSLLNERMNLLIREAGPRGSQLMSQVGFASQLSERTYDDSVEAKQELSASAQSAIRDSRDAATERELVDIMTDLKGKDKYEFQLKLLRQTYADQPEELAKIDALENRVFAEDETKESPSATVSSLGEKLVVSDRTAPRMKRGKKLTDLKEEQARLAGNEREKPRRGSKVASPIGVQAFDEDIQKLNDLIEKEDRAGLKQGYQNRRDQLIKQRKEAVKKLNKANDEYSDYVMGAVDKEISLLESINNPTEDQKNQLAALNEEKVRLLKAGVTTEAMRTEAYKSLSKKVKDIYNPDDKINPFKDKDAEFVKSVIRQMDEAVEGGVLSFDERETAAADKVIKANNIRNIGDFAGKQPADQLIIQAAVAIALAPTKNAKEQFVEALLGTVQGSNFGAMPLDIAEADRKERELGLEQRKFARLLRNDNKLSQTDRTSLFKTFEEVDSLVLRMADGSFDPDATDEDGETFGQKALLRMRELQRTIELRPNLSPQVKAALVKSFSSLLSAYTGRVAGDNNWFGGVNVQSDDFDIQNIVTNDTEREGVTSIIYRGPSGRDASLTVGQLRDALKGQEELVNLILSIGLDNAKKRTGTDSE
mgnify:FL=1